MNDRGLEDAGGVRQLTSRWVIMGEVVLETAAHFGCEEGNSADMTIIRDAREGRALLTGPSLAGALRSYLADVLGGYFSEEHEDVKRLFGGRRGDEEGAQSPLIVFDALGKTPEETAIEIRDGVAIDPITGTAEAHRKFDFEVLPAGTVFPVRFDLLVEDGANESLLLPLLVTALEGLSKGEIHMGMRRSRGLGRIRAGKWKVKRYDLGSQNGWLAWVSVDPLIPLAEVDAREDLEEAMAEARGEWEKVSFTDQRRRMVAELKLELKGDLLARSPASEPDAPDVVHLHSGGRPVLPGTGLTGALRAQALRIARAVRNGNGDKLVDQIFGPRLEGTTSRNFHSRASRLHVSESAVEEGQARRQTRIAVDRFTGGVVEGALFDEEVIVGGRTRVRLELRNPTDAEMGLVLLLVRDLLMGEIPVGGGVSAGRGLLTGEAEITFPDGKCVRVSRELTVEEDESVLNKKIWAFHEEGTHERT